VRMKHHETTLPAGLLKRWQRLFRKTGSLVGWPGFNAFSDFEPRTTTTPFATTAAIPVVGSLPCSQVALFCGGFRIEPGAGTEGGF